MFFIYWIVSGMLAVAAILHGLSKHYKDDLLVYIVNKLEGCGKNPKKDFGDLTFSGLVITIQQDLVRELKRKPTQDELFERVLSLYDDIQLETEAGTSVKHMFMGIHTAILCGVFLLGFILWPIVFVVKIYKLLNK